MTMGQMKLWLREGARIDRNKWKQNLIAMRLAQRDDEDAADAINKALED